MLYIYPRRRRLRNTLPHRLLGERLFDHHLWKPDRYSVAGGIALGVFSGLLPIFGFQMLLGCFLAIFFRVNVPLSALATLISNPLTAPGMLMLEYQIGQWIVAHWLPVFHAGSEAHLNKVLQYGLPLMTGSFAIALFGGGLTWLIMVGLAKIWPQRWMKHLQFRSVHRFHKEKEKKE